MGDISTNPFFARVTVTNLDDQEATKVHTTVPATPSKLLQVPTEKQRDEVNGTWLYDGDEKLFCSICNKPFIFSRHDKERFDKLGYSKPKACKDCRKTRSNRVGGVPHKDAPPAPPVVHLKGLHHSCQLNEIASIFEAKEIFGTFKNGIDIVFHRQHKDERKNSYAFVKFATTDLAKKALELTVRCPFSQFQLSISELQPGQQKLAGHCEWNKTIWHDTPHKTFRE